MKSRIGLMLIILAIATGLPLAEAQNVTTISKCGTMINAPGNYAVIQSLTSTSPTVDCIDISSPGVALSLGGNLSGPGGTSVTAKGIKVLSSAYGVGLGFNGQTIQGFGIGLEIEASGVTIIDGGTLMGNAAQGMLVKNASSVTINNLTSQQNGGAGLELQGASGVIVQGTPVLQNNGGYGLWVNSSSGNFFYNLLLSDNKLSGMYIGESSTDRLKQTIADPQPSRDNVVLNSTTLQNDGAGFAIALGDSHNVITGSEGQQNTDRDAVDENSACDHNQWVGNTFGTSNKTCIH